MFTRVLLVVVAAGLVTLMLSTIVVVFIVLDHEEARLFDKTVRRVRQVSMTTDLRLRNARKELDAIATSTHEGRAYEASQLFGDTLRAVRCVRMSTGEALFDAAQGDGARRVLRSQRAPRPDQVMFIAPSSVLLTTRVGDVEAVGLLALEPTPLVPDGWAVRWDFSGFRVRPLAGENVPSAKPIPVKAHDETNALGEDIIRATAVLPYGPRIQVDAPLAPARETGFAVSRMVVRWSLLAILPLVLIAWLLGRAVTQPLGILARALREAGNGPVVLPELPSDEVGDLGQAIAAMSARLSTETGALRAAVSFARRVARLRTPQEVVRALDTALREAFPNEGWTIVPVEAIENGRVPRELGVRASTLRWVLTAGDDPSTARPESGEQSLTRSTAVQVRAVTNVEGAQGTVLIALRGLGWQQGVVVGRGGLDEELVVRHAELLCRTAATAIQTLELTRSAVANEKLAVLGRVAAGVAHEMNNPLAFLVANVSALEERLGGEMREMAIEAREGAERLARIVSDLSSISRGGAQLTVAECDLWDLARSAVKVTRSRRPDVEIEVRGVRSVWITCDRVRIEQILLNLVDNASFAAQGNPSPRVTVTLRNDGAFAVVEVRDNGSGISGEAKRRVFEAFFTTKGEHGTGLGLFLSRSFAQAHRGDVDLVSTGVDGTTFRLRLPIAARMSTPPNRDSLNRTSNSLQISNRPRVLVLDDESAIVRSMTRWLSRHADVTGSTNPHEALTLANSSEFSLVLCDLHMPEMSGIDFVSALEARAPEVADRVVLMTGSTSEPPPGRRMVRKPLRRSVIETLLG